MTTEVNSQSNTPSFAHALSCKAKLDEVPSPALSHDSTASTVFHSSASTPRESETVSQSRPDHSPSDADYDPDTLLHFLAQQSKLNTTDPLRNHKISEGLRERMVDWMTEVTSKADCSPSTLFYAVSIMDRFLTKCQTPLSSADMHPLGVVCMLVASKLEDVAVMDEGFMYEHVVHGKISIARMSALERTVLQTLGFWVSAPNEELIISELLRALAAGSTKREDDIFSSPEFFNLLREEAQGVATLNLFNYRFRSVRPAALAAGSILYVLRKEGLEQAVDPSTLARLAGETVELLTGITAEIDAHIANFRELHPIANKVFDRVNNQGVQLVE